MGSGKRWRIAPVAAGTSRISPSSKIMAGKRELVDDRRGRIGDAEPLRGVDGAVQAVDAGDGPRVQAVRAGPRQDVRDARGAPDAEDGTEASLGEPVVELPLLQRGVEQPPEIGIVHACRKARVHHRDVQAIGDAGRDGLDVGERARERRRGDVGGPRPWRGGRTRTPLARRARRRCRAPGGPRRRGERAAAPPALPMAPAPRTAILIPAPPLRPAAPVGSGVRACTTRDIRCTGRRPRTSGRRRCGRRSAPRRPPRSTCSSRRRRQRCR